MIVNEIRVDEIFNNLCAQIEEVTDGRVADNYYKILERRAKFHESEERRTKEQLEIILNELKQEKVYREINIKINRFKEGAAAYRKAKQGF